MNLKKLLSEEKVVIAVKSHEDLELALKEKSKIIFILFGDILNIEELTRRVKECGKISFVHLDMIEGLDSKGEKSIEYLREFTYASGVISTKGGIIKYAKKVGFLGIQRCFLIDSLSFENARKILAEGNADAVEILPGVMPKIIKLIASEAKIPIIAGGLIKDSEDIELALSSGASGVSTTNIKVIKEFNKSKL